MRAGALALGYAIVLLLGSDVRTVSAQDVTVLDKLAGTWREDESRQQLGGVGVIFNQNGNRIEEIRGGEVSPMVIPLVFDDKPHAIPGANKIQWKQIDATTFRSTLIAPGDKPLAVRTFRLAGDGNTLTVESVQTPLNGQNRTVTTVYRRSSGDKGLVGRWKPQSVKSTQPDEFRIERAGVKGIKWTDQRGFTFSAGIDGKPVVMTGAGVIVGTMRAIRVTGTDAITATTSRNGKDIASEEWKLSPDAKTLTITSRPTNAPEQQSVSVYVKR